MSLQYYLHQGSSALSDFRSERLAWRLRAYQVTAKYVHYVALTEALDDGTKLRLDALLSYHDVLPNRASKDTPEGFKTYTLYVSPRTGTISPWSSKATSIAHVCSLGTKVRRIERGTVFFVTTDLDIANATWTEGLYDRMTQILTREPPDLDEMFAQGTPAPATIVSIHDQRVAPDEALAEANKKYWLALDASEIDYLAEAYGANGSIGRNPYLEELFMFAQVNSEVLTPRHT